MRRKRTTAPPAAATLTEDQRRKRSRRRAEAQGDTEWLAAEREREQGERDARLKRRASESAADHLIRLRGELAAGPPDPPDQDPRVVKARQELEAAQVAVQAAPDAGAPGHPALVRRLNEAAAAFRETTVVVDAEDDGRRAQLHQAVREAHHQAELEVGKLAGQVLERARARAENDPRSLSEALDGFAQLAAGQVRVRIEDDEDLRLVIERVHDFQPLKPGQVAWGAIGQVSERLPDGRPISAIIVLRDWGMVTVPIDLLEPVPAGLSVR